MCKEPVENKPHINADTHTHGRRCRGKGSQWGRLCVGGAKMAKT